MLAWRHRLTGCISPPDFLATSIVTESVSMWKFLQSRPWWLLASSLLLILLGWGAYRLWFAKAPAPPLITATVERGDLEDAVLASGTIQASRLINVGS